MLPGTVTMSSNRSPVDILFKEHSFEEISSVRDNLASEINKRTELLKSIVKEKYRDVVDTSDAIQSMKLNLSKVEQSIHQLDGSISTFYGRIREPQITTRSAGRLLLSQQQSNSEPERSQLEDDLKKLLSTTTEIWDHFDSNNLKATIKTHKDARELLESCRSRDTDDKMGPIIKNVEYNLQRSSMIIKNHLWHKIQSAESNQIGVIVNDDDNGDLYRLSMEASMEHLVEKLRKDMLDISFQAQMRRYQQYSYFNTESNTIDDTSSDMKPPATGYLQIPKDISPELSNYLFNTCRVINTIAGFSLVRASILESLRMTMMQIVSAYEDLLHVIEALVGGSRRRRALQLYFDLMYVRVLLNTSKNLELIEAIDPQISTLMSKYETLLDSIELYIVSDAMHTNVLKTIKSTVRLYGLLVPYLQ